MSAQSGHAPDALAQRYQDTLARIRHAEQVHQRKAGSVQLIAVSKTHAGERIRALAGLGQRAFGENYLQESASKVAELADLGLEWHFIGHIQSNKCRDIAELFDWVHSVDSLKVARRLSAARDAGRPDLQVLLQVNVQMESSKSGVAIEALGPLADQIAGLPRLRLRGLMAIPAPEPDFERQRVVFARLRRALADLNDNGAALDCLSMGMTDDLEAAIAEGATHVRVGTAVFGPRPPKA